MVGRRTYATTRTIALALALVGVGCTGAEHARVPSARPPLPRGEPTTADLAPGHRFCSADDLSAVVQEVNVLRRKYGLRQLGNDTYLARFARSRSAAMAAERRLSHTGYEQALRQAGLEDDSIGENVAYNFDTPEAVMEGWLASPGHRDNILRPAYKRIGVGCVIDDRGHRWWTQDFAG